MMNQVIHGGLADRSGLLYPGDKLVEVNGEPVEGLEPVQVIHILVHSQGTILFKLIPNSPQPAISQSIMFVRAMVDYNPLQDPSIPCPDAGMAFSKGDLLEIVDQKDIQWWQAKQMPNATACAGLIPSISHFRSKKREFWWSQPYQAHTCIKPCKRKALIKRRQSCHSCSSNSCASASPYEEVINYQRNANEAPRLIILTGPSGVGINEIRRRLVKFNPNTFQAPIPYTTRPPRGTELNGREYHFITKELFEYLVVNHKFIEYGEHKGHLYGTCYDSIKDVLDSGKTCIIDLDPHCIPAARTKILNLTPLPYIIFVKPPSVKRMKLTRRDAKFIAGSYFKRTFRDEDFEEIEEAGKLMKAQYSQFFDCVIVNDRLQDTCRDLFAAIRHAQEEPQWIPASWISLDEP
uniref:Membrane protein, palmitoylated 4a (MAGUK p55 subfamily member 4) n=1 Tax=Astyanax mexicanus TaxID=7994 RepID=A0A8B9HL72_ASTMX